MLARKTEMPIFVRRIDRINKRPFQDGGKSFSKQIQISIVKGMKKQIFKTFYCLMNFVGVFNCINLSNI